jgi:pyruvate kinase
MADTIRATENSPIDELPNFNVSAERGVPQVLGATVRIVSDALGHAPIVVLSDSGHTAREVSSFRPDASIHAMTPDATVDRQCRLLWGVTPHVMGKMPNSEKRAAHALALLVRRKAFRRGTRVVLVSGTGKPGSANKIEILTA